MEANQQLVIRTEKESDYDQVFRVNVVAFRNSEDESRLIERIRLSDRFIQELSLVAGENDRIVGHALFSKAEVVDGETSHEVIVLAPIAVRPRYQKQGIGGRLIQEGIRRCRNLGYDYIFLIGHPTYYPKFGFKPARQYGFELKQFKVSDDVFMVYEMNEGMNGIKGELKYPAAFFAEAEL